MSTLGNPVPQWSLTRWVASIYKAFVLASLGCLSFVLVVTVAFLIFLGSVSESRDPDQCLEPYDNLERDIRAGLEDGTKVVRIAMVEPDSLYVYIGALVTSPDFEGEHVAVWATNRVYDPGFWGPKEVGDIVPVNPAAMTVSVQHYQPWIAPEWFQTASRRIGKEPTLIARVSMDDKGAQRAVECVGDSDKSLSRIDRWHNDADGPDLARRFVAAPGVLASTAWLRARTYLAGGRDVFTAEVQESGARAPAQCPSGCHGPPRPPE